MDIFTAIALGIVGLIGSAALSVFAGLIATAIIAVRRLIRKRKQGVIVNQEEPKQLPYAVNYRKVEDQHGNVHEDVTIQYSDGTELKQVGDSFQALPKSTKSKLGAKKNVLYLFALNKLKKQIRALKKETEKEKADIMSLLRCMRQFRGRMSGEQYEVYCAIMLTHLGYKQIILTPVTGDFGADIIATKGNERYCFQCKCYSAPVGIQAVQEVHSARTYYHCSSAGVITNSTFTPAALELADRLDVMMVDDF